MQLGPSRYERDPLEDSRHVIEQLQANGTVDKVAQQAMAALRQDDAFRAHVRHWLATQGYVPGDKRSTRPSALTGPGEQYAVLEAMACAALADLLTGAGQEAAAAAAAAAAGHSAPLTHDQQRPRHELAADNQLKVQTTLVEMLEAEELALQAQFEAAYKRHLAALQPHTRPVRFLPHAAPDPHHHPLQAQVQQQQQQQPAQQQQRRPQP